MNLAEDLVSMAQGWEGSMERVTLLKLLFFLSDVVRDGLRRSGDTHREDSAPALLMVA